ncbi:helix-turn-helix domain-containing protein [Nitratifractor salsuginis]|uniref:Helix-turn-helix domain protein n=1 Tax=Nitratifractor salsuginis (strain DSM 16511 / JCM 12458 / E9I37-1) TaxID=749222 RepID=E6WYC8_NITSE|nr:helix-turn-helix transcriptional regulator [Nitratifractor salsuginis]ADV46440.1 helix-turn-helix domain protein [Nitratifractor salsuginis DSM 16511]
MNDYNLKEEIKSLGMTQKEFAANIGVAENTVSQWVRGVIDTPRWVPRMIELLHKEKKYEQAKKAFCNK